MSVCTFEGIARQAKEAAASTQRRFQAAAVRKKTAPAAVSHALSSLSLSLSASERAHLSHTSQSAER